MIKQIIEILVAASSAIALFCIGVHIGKNFGSLQKFFVAFFDVLKKRIEK